jgi:uncharacterized membrane protein
VEKMLEKIYKIKHSIWVTPAVISLISLLFAITIGLLDSSPGIELDNYIPDIFLTSVDLSKTILSVIASALIGMTTFTFSITMVVLTTYSSQFSPRVVENFLSDDETMKTLGIFMGGFLYSIMALSFMRNNLGDRLVISAIIGTIFAVYCLVNFLKYINHVGSFIQTNNLIQRLQDEAVKEIGDYREFIQQGENVSRVEAECTDCIIRVKSETSGYIQFIDRKKIISIGKDIQGLIVVESVAGEFVTDDTEIFTLYFKDEEDMDKKVAKLRGCITFGNTQIDLQNFNFSIQKLVEIALRAISPGINDPNTANHCLKIAGVLIGMVADIANGYLVIEDEEKSSQSVAFKLIDFHNILYFTFYQIVHYGKEDISVMLSLVNALGYIREKASPENREAVLQFLDYLWSKMAPELKTGYDNEILERERYKILN